MKNEIVDPEVKSSIDENKETAFLAEQYQVLSNRRISQNDLFWNVPFVFLTAQSFLLILALGGYSSHPWEKAIGAFISFVFGLLSIQVFERNRVMEITDAEQLLDIERYLLDHGYKTLEIHQKHIERRYLNGELVHRRLDQRKILRFLNRGVSYELWKKGMWLTTIVSFGLFLYNSMLYLYKNFLGFSGFTDFLTSVDESAVGTLVIIFALNWIMYIFNHIESKQPGTSIKNARGKSRKKDVLEDNALLIIELIGIIAVIIYSCIARENKIQILPNLWLYLFIFCTICMSFYSVMHFRILRKAVKKVAIFLFHIPEKRSSSKECTEDIETLILAGGKGARLQSIIKNCAKFIAIKSENKTLLENAVYRNRRVSKRQVIITNSEYYGSICRLPDIASRLEDEEQKSKVSNQLLRRCCHFRGRRNAVVGENSIKVSKVKSLDFIREPCNKGTATAIYHFLAKSILADEELGLQRDPVVIIAPSDHVISDTENYNQIMQKACYLAEEFGNIYLFGIVPTYPSSLYGYISVNSTTGSVLKVLEFLEKPETDEANARLQHGRVLWNSGIFIAKRSIFIKAFRDSNWRSCELFSGFDFSEPELKQMYERAEDSSFDKDILEHVSNLYAITVTFDWADVGDPERLQSAIIDGYCSLEIPQ